MDYLDLLQQIFNLCIVPLIGILCNFLIQYLRKKSQEIIVETDNELLQKYLTMLTDTIVTCVIATNQTYVNALKEENAFDAEAQKKAFEMTYQAVMAILSDEAKKYLESAMGDLNVYITQQIEAQVNAQKFYAA